MINIGDRSRQLYLAICCVELSATLESWHIQKTMKSKESPWIECSSSRLEGREDDLSFRYSWLASSKKGRFECCQQKMWSSTRWGVERVRKRPLFLDKTFIFMALSQSFTVQFLCYQKIICFLSATVSLIDPCSQFYVDCRITNLKSVDCFNEKPNHMI